MADIRPLAITFADDGINDLRQRLKQARLPSQLSAVPWRDGLDVDYLKDLIGYWAEGFDWEKAAQSLNQFDHFVTEIDGLDTHFIHQRSPHPNAMPLIITHGWPGSVVEFLSVIRKLAFPEEWGQDSSQAFHVVCPSLPGFGWSQAAPVSGMNARAIAQRHSQLMARLGYDKYLAQGGDWGSVITRQLAVVDPDHCAGIHLNMLPMRPTDEMLAGIPQLAPEEQHALGRAGEFQTTGMAYYQVQSTQPQTLAYALDDSPVGMAAWIAEKFYSWSDHAGDPTQAIDRDALLTNLSLYWLTRTAGSSLQIYREEAVAPSPSEYVAAPTGVAVFPKEIMFTPRSWAEREFNIVHWQEQPKGGHFAALEQPELFAKDLFLFRKTLGI